MNSASIAKKLLVVLTLLGLLLATAGNAGAQTPFVRYAKAGGLTSGTCTGDWTSACELWYALNQAASGDEVWVAAGIYKPSVRWPSSGDPRTVTFTMKDGVAIYGGFTGTETSRDGRNSDPATNGTVLSGDIDATAGPSGGDAYHVVNTDVLNWGSSLVDAIGVTSSAVLDGFTITGGYATNSTPNPHGHGGGMWVHQGSPTLRNLRFVGNTASGSGGGMYIEPCYTSTPDEDCIDTNPSLTNIVFEGNTATGSADGGGMKIDGYLNYSGSASLAPTLTDVTFTGNSARMGGGLEANDAWPALLRVTFSGNTASYAGGGMNGRFDDSGRTMTLTDVDFINNSAPKGGGLDFGVGSYTDTSSLSATNVRFLGNDATGSDGGGMQVSMGNATLVNALFSGNTATGSGGGVAGGPYSNVTLINSTFSGNSSGTAGSAILAYSTVDDPAVMNLRNSIVYGNTGGAGKQISQGPYCSAWDEWAACDASISYSLLEGVCPAGADCIGLKSGDPLFADADGADSTLGTADDDPSLTKGSPAIDAGDNSYVTGTATLDVVGQPRFHDDPGILPNVAPTEQAPVDMGAYEFQGDSTLPVVITGPDTLRATYVTQYSQQLTASGGTGSYSFSLPSGTLPVGITLSSSGLLSGLVQPPSGSAPGTYPITIQVEDANQDTASRAYDFVLDKATPTVTVGASDPAYWNQPFDLWANVKKEMGNAGNALPSGTVGFYVDGTLVPGCDAVVPNLGRASCDGVSMNLGIGTHTVRADYTPTGVEAYYNTATASGTFTMQPRLYYISGTLFRDDNQNGVWDAGESRLQKYDWTINLDENCDGIANLTTATDSFASFGFSNVPSSGQCYRITVAGEPGYRQTTQLADFVLTGHISVNVGFYYPTITLSPSELPSGNLGVEYNQVLTASGGAGSYKYTITGGDLPIGLTLGEGGVLSGTPTSAGLYSFTVQAEDANHAVGRASYDLALKTNGNFTFTSSLNPSAPGQAVTFTVSAIGNAVLSGFGPIPPLGSVTFSADGTPVEGCSDLVLNILLNENGYPVEPGDYPATCTTTALETGSHEITATYSGFELADLYNTPTLTLTQQVDTAGNTAPTANPGGPYLGAINTAIAFDGSLSSDPDEDILTYAWTFGDGGTGTSAAANNSYTAAGVYNVCLTVNDGALSSAEVCTMAVVYDPSAGFVTGGGWINSPAGAYKLDESLSGKATFGFVSKYQKGAKVPSGTTAFEFATAGLEFSSTSYEWLVVNKVGNNAQFKGSGTVNGATDPNGNAYKFQLWATDSSPDTFRIKIWWEGTDAVEHVVYGNGVEQAIGAGNIVVHTGK